MSSNIEKITSPEYHRICHLAKLELKKSSDPQIQAALEIAEKAEFLLNSMYFNKCFKPKSEQMTESEFNAAYWELLDRLLPEAQDAIRLVDGLLQQIMLKKFGIPPDVTIIPIPL